jgi:hypothetical protein
MKNRILSLLILFSYSLFNVALSQNQEHKFNLKIRLIINDKSPEDALIAITKDNMPFKIYKASDTLNYQKLDFNANYLVACSKNGYVSKSIEVNTHLNKKDSSIIMAKAGWDFQYFAMDVHLEKQPDDAILEYVKPVGIIKYSEEKNNFEYVRKKHKTKRTPLDPKDIVKTTKDTVKVDTIFKLNLTVNLDTEDNNAKGAKVTITKDDKPFTEFTYDTLSYKSDMEMNSKYVFTCSKDGYITKSIIVNTHIPKYKDEKPFKKLSTTIELKRQPKNYIVTNLEPVGYIYYNYRTASFMFSKPDYKTSERDITSTNKK